MDVDTDRANSLDTDETYDLISSEKVDGTSVYSRNGDKLGSIDHVMIGKRDGRVRCSASAVCSRGIAIIRSPGMRLLTTPSKTVTRSRLTRSS